MAAPVGAKWEVLIARIVPAETSGSTSRIKRASVPDMPRRELRHAQQVEDWLTDVNRRITQPAKMTLIGSGALLWHAFQLGVTEPLPENSMDVDPITDSDEVARLCYEALIGSEFERINGWHVNLMPELVMREFPADWELRALAKNYGKLLVVAPSIADLLVPKLRRNEPRDRVHSEWAKQYLLAP